MIGNMSWGMYQFRSELMKEFLSLGHRVVVIAPRDEWSEKIKALGCEFIDIKVSRKGANPIQDLVYFFSLTHLLLKIKPDIALNYTVKPVIYGTLASWLASVPYRIAITTGLGYTFNHDNWVSKVTKCLYWFTLKFASQVWFLNSDDLKTFLDNNLITRSKAFILPGEGVDIDHYQPSSQKSSQITFTLIGRMLWDKGVGIFAECAHELKKMNPDLNFLVVGPVDEGNPEGIPLKQLQEWHDKGDITYLGQKNDVREVLTLTTCLIHPTYYREGIPRVLMEANSMGIPCITTDIPGCREVIKHGENGFLIKPKDKQSLKEAILKFLELDVHQEKRVSALAREIVVSNFSSNRINSIYREKLVL